MHFWKKHEKLLKKFLSLFIWSRNLRGQIKDALTYHDGLVTFIKKSKQLKSENKASLKTGYKHIVSIVAIMKNEAPYLQEWIEYYLSIGITKFYLYDNDSTDNTVEILKPYIDKGIVQYTYFPGETMQVPAYTHFLQHFKNETKWAMIIDLDEFLVSKKTSLIEFLTKQNNNISQIIVPWIFFGSNGHITKPQGLVIENYTKRAIKPRLYKAIINPRLVLEMQCHKHITTGKTIFPKMDNLLINHYYCKSLEEYQRRASRGDALNGKDFAKKEFVKSTFDKFDSNDIYDPFILQIVCRYYKKQY